MYIARHIEKTIEKSFAAFPAVLITGPRQVGKSTLLLNRFKNIPNVTLDNPLQLLSLRQDPVEFFKLHGSPLILDEVQRAPECFSVLKYMIDSDRRAGMYILTGSQKYALMKGVSESLAGRIGIPTGKSTKIRSTVLFCPHRIISLNAVRRWLRPFKIYGKGFIAAACRNYTRMKTWIGNNTMQPM